MGNIPMVKKLNGIDTLYVNNQPYFALAGEVHNSSASNLEFMEKEVWTNFKGLNMNTAVVPLYWECIEPAEGKYQFDLIDGLIAQARENDMKLIFLWFGLWKNAESMYIPGWMKKDSITYFRAKKITGESLNTISPLCKIAVQKDAMAFKQVMAHIKSVDEEQTTVITMQVENEIGLLGTERDYSEVANQFFEEKIPEELEIFAKKDLTWKEAFGVDAEEYFMAYYFAKAVEYITKLGQNEYPLPCYTNAWLKQYPWNPGSYPSGGPVKEVHKLWKLAAPSLFTLAPDIYVPMVADVMEEYTYEGNPLVIPEVRKDATTASYCMHAFGAHNALCYSPFAIEKLSMPEEMVDKPPMEVMIALNIDPSAFETKNSKRYLSKVYNFINQIKPIYLQYRGSHHLQSYLKKNSNDFGTWLHFDQYDVSVAYGQPMPESPVAAGWIIETKENEFYICGMMSTIQFKVKPGENLKCDMLKVEEGYFKNGQWVKGRILNGDEKMSLRLGPDLTCIKVQLFKY